MSRRNSNLPGLYHGVCTGLLSRMQKVTYMQLSDRIYQWRRDGQREYCPADPTFIKWTAAKNAEKSGKMENRKSRIKYHPQTFLEKRIK